MNRREREQLTEIVGACLAAVAVVTIIAWTVHTVQRQRATAAVLRPMDDVLVPLRRD